MIAFRQPIKPGDAGSDVVAVKRVLKALGYKKMNLSRKAGPAYVAALKTFQKKRKLTADGIYGPATHKKIAPQFDRYGVWLYGHATIREPPALKKMRDLLAFCRTFSGPYVYGGGHGPPLSRLSPHQGLDCSSSCSLALYHAGLMVGSVAQVSTWFESYSASGNGKYLTIHANAEHVWLEFTLPEGWFRFDTDPQGQGANGPRVRTLKRHDYHFVHRHPRGF